MTSVSVVIPREVKSYYFQEKAKASPDYSRLVRTVSEVGGKSLVAYSLSYYPRMSALFEGLRGRGASRLASVAVVPLLESDLTARLRKVREGKFGRAVETVIKAGLGKGVGESGRVLDGEYWMEVLNPNHDVGSGIMYFYWLRSESRLSFSEWSKLKDLPDDQVGAEMRGAKEEAVEAYSAALRMVREKIVEEMMVGLSASGVDIHNVTVGDDGEVRFFTHDSEVPVRSFRNELVLERMGWKVAHFTAAQREVYRVSIERGANILRNRSGEALREGPFIFAQASDGSIFAHRTETGRFHHSSFLSGQAVRAAGELVTDAAGKIVEINNESGHYKPTTKQMANLLIHLKERGVDLTQIRLRLLGAVRMNFDSAEDFLGIYQQVAQAQREGGDLSQLKVSQDGIQIPAKIFLGS